MKTSAAIVVFVVGLALSVWTLCRIVGDSNDLIAKDAAKKGFDAGIHYAVKKSIEHKMLMAPDQSASSFDGCIFVRVIEVRNEPLLSISDKATKVLIANSSFYQMPITEKEDYLVYLK